MVTGWHRGQRVAVARPELVRKLVVAGSAPGIVPDMPPPTDKVLGIMAKPDADDDDILYLFYPDTDAARTAGRDHPRSRRGTPTAARRCPSRPQWDNSKQWGRSWPSRGTTFDRTSSPSSNRSCTPTASTT